MHVQWSLESEGVFSITALCTWKKQCENLNNIGIVISTIYHVKKTCLEKQAWKNKLLIRQPVTMYWLSPLPVTKRTMTSMCFYRGRGVILSMGCFKQKFPVCPFCLHDLTSLECVHFLAGIRSHRCYISNCIPWCWLSFLLNRALEGFFSLIIYWF